MGGLLAVGTATSSDHRASDLAGGLILVGGLLVGLASLDTGMAAGLGPDLGVTAVGHS